jgi:hypothetical protein
MLSKLAVTGHHLENEPELSGLVRHRFSGRNRIRRFVVLFTSEKTEGFVRVSFVRQSGFMFPSCRTRTAARKNVDDLMANQRVMARTFAIPRKGHLEFSQHNDIPGHVLINAVVVHLKEPRR